MKISKQSKVWFALLLAMIVQSVSLAQEREVKA